MGPNDTIVGLYADTLYPEGINGISDAVRAIEGGTADRIVQTERDNMEPPSPPRKTNSISIYP